MSDLSREQRLSSTFVTLADTLVDHFDVVELLDELVRTSVELLDTDAGGLMLADSSGRLQVVASTSEAANLVELMQMNAGEGPCIECFTTGEPVAVADIELLGGRWPAFVEGAAAGGFRSVFATPLRLRGTTIGAMNLFGVRPGVLNEQDVQAARALADVATIGILQERLLRESTLVTEQLQFALDSRVIIEQAKGVLAEAGSITLDEAFVLLRDYARRTRTPLRTVAEALATRTMSPETITTAPAKK